MARWSCDLCRPAFTSPKAVRDLILAAAGFNVRLILHDASVSGDLPDLPCAVMGGELVVGGARHDNSMPVPFEAAECVELRLIFDEMHSATVAGRGVRLELLGEARYVEEFRP